METYPLHFPYLYLLLSIVALLVLVSHAGRCRPLQGGDAPTLSAQGRWRAAQGGLQQQREERAQESSLGGVGTPHLSTWRRL